MLPDDNGGWQTREVAQAQADLVERELAALRLSRTNRATAADAPLLAEPYTPFLAAMDAIAAPSGSRLLDAGCGVGHYGTVLRYLRPAIHYTGTDFSRHMIAIARKREPALTFLIRAILDNQFDAYDIVLLSQCLEITDTPLSNLVFVLWQAEGYIILHRLRLGQDTGRITEPTYAGHIGNNWLWRQSDLEALVKGAGRRYEVIPWTRPDMLTMVLWPPH